MTNKQKKYLKSLMHDVKPTFIIGKDGFNDRQLNDLFNHFNKNELAKIKLLETAPVHLNEVIQVLEENNFMIVDKIGRTIVVYKENDKLTNKLVLPN